MFSGLNSEIDELSLVKLMLMYMSYIQLPFDHWKILLCENNLHENWFNLHEFCIYLRGMTALSIHHTFETLSSNTPRANGKILCKT